MAERVVPGLTFEQIKNTAKRPKEVSTERWEMGLAVIETLMKIGQPTNVLEDSVDGSNIPNKYYVTGTGVTVEHMPHWGYAIVDIGETRRSILFSKLVTSEDAAVPFTVKALPKEEVIVNLKDAIVKAWR